MCDIPWHGRYSRVSLDLPILIIFQVDHSTLTTLSQNRFSPPMWLWWREFNYIININQRCQLINLGYWWGLGLITALLCLINMCKTQNVPKCNFENAVHHQFCAAGVIYISSYDQYSTPIYLSWLQMKIRNNIFCYYM